MFNPGLHFCLSVGYFCSFPVHDCNTENHQSALKRFSDSPGILTFTASFNLEKAVGCHSCLFFLSGCYFVVFGVFCSVSLCLVGGIYAFLF